MKQKRKQGAKWYQQLLADDDRIIVPVEAANSDLSWFVFVIRLKEKFTFEQRNKILEAMTKAGIQVSNYFSPVHLQPFIAEKFGYKKGDFPITESVSQRTIALPFYNNLSRDDVALVCRTLKEVLDKI
jgi:perosamine synthetase